MADRYQKLVGNTRKYPYLVGVSTESQLGTGILIGPQLVLTCGHVLTNSDLIQVISAKGVTSAHRKEVDEASDLALLELEKPLSAPKVRFTDSPLRAGARLRAVGVQESPDCPHILTVAETKLKYQNRNDASGAILDIQLGGGARPGYSGGPIVLNQCWTSLCVGVTRCGGQWSHSSNAVGLGHIRAFVPEDVPLYEGRAWNCNLLAAFLLAALAVAAAAAWHRVHNTAGSAVVSALLIRPGPEGLRHLVSGGSVHVLHKTTGEDVEIGRIAPNPAASVLVGEAPEALPDTMINDWRLELAGREMSDTDRAIILRAWKTPQILKLPDFKTGFAAQKIKIVLTSASGVVSECGTIDLATVSGPVADVELHRPPC